jgi:hypothetical protein
MMSASSSHSTRVNGTTDDYVPPYLAERGSTSGSGHDFASQKDALVAEGFVVTCDGKVTWTKDHHLHPRKWPLRRKIYDTGVMFILEFFTTLISNTGVSHDYVNKD